MSKLKVRGEFITWTGKVTGRSCKIELDITEEDIREAIIKITSQFGTLKSGDFIYALKKGILELLTGSEGEKEIDKSKLQSPDRFKTVNLAKPKEERRCKDCMLSKTCDTRKKYQFTKDCSEFQPKEKKEEKRSCLYCDKYSPERICKLGDLASAVACRDSGYLRWQPKQPPKVVPDWKGMEIVITDDDVERGIKHNRLQRVVKDIYEKVEGEKK